MLFFEDMTIGRIDRYGAKLVDRAEVIAFARDYDPQPFHLDDAAMTHRMTVDYWAGRGRAILAGLGFEDLAWLKPVYPGDTLRCESEILDARVSASRPDAGVVRGETRVFNQHDEPVMRLVASFLIRRCP